MPTCWNDDERMNFLFQPFRPKEANPESYDAKMKFWVELISDYIRFQQSEKADLNGNIKNQVEYFAA